jgi:hypothetical protein
MISTHQPRTTGFVLLTLAGLGLFFAAYLVVSPNVPASDQTKNESDSERKQKMMEELGRAELQPFPATEGKEECETFFRDFGKQKNIDYLQPGITADKLDDSRLQARIKHCPSLELPKNCFWRWAHGEGIVPKFYRDFSSREGCAEEANGTKNFRIYDVDLDNNASNGTEIIYYEGGLEGHSQYFGGVYRRYFGGMYKLLDLRSCSVAAYVHVPQVGSHDTTKFHEHGFVRYNGRIYLFDFTINEYPNAKQSYANLHLYNLELTQRHGVLFRSTCIWGPPLPKTSGVGK